MIRQLRRPPRAIACRAGAAIAAALAICVCAPAALAAAPNDPGFSLQWGDQNTGQLIPTQENGEVLGPEEAGTPGADDHALEAWGVTTGSRSIVIGEADTGVEYNDPDLAANVWSNPASGSGHIAECALGAHGYDVLTHKCEPMDDETTGEGGYGGHGTHVAGIMGAVGNNGIGVAGINWQTTILPVKWLKTANGTDNVKALTEALRWLVKAKEAGVNVRVVNDSPTFEETGPSAELEQAIEALGEHEILFVTSAGNNGEDDDEASVLRYPCKYKLANEICVTASDDEDTLPDWANFGPETVALAAPGVSIYSTLRGDTYNYLSGASMAAAQVSGAAALILSAKPALTTAQLKAAILGSVDPLPSLAGKVLTGGRLDVAKALPALVSAVAPSGGAHGGGTAVTIAGANLANATGVSFGTSHAPFTIVSPTSIVATAPPGSGTVDVTVTAPGGTSAISAGDRFAYEAEPPPSSGGSPETHTPGGGQAQSPATSESTSAPAVGSPSPQSSVLATSAGTSALALVTSTAFVERGKASVELRCVGSRPCASTLTLAVRQLVRHGHGPASSRLVTIGRVGFALTPGQARQVAVALDATGRTLLNAGHGRLGALLAIPRSADGASGSLSRDVRLLLHTSSTRKPGG